MCKRCEPSSLPEAFEADNHTRRLLQCGLTNGFEGIDKYLLVIRRLMEMSDRDGVRPFLHVQNLIEDWSIVLAVGDKASGYSGKVVEAVARTSEYPTIETFAPTREGDKACVARFAQLSQGMWDASLGMATLGTAAA